MFDRITILGVGLIGASFARAAKRRGLCRHITGFGRNADTLGKARELGIIDSFETDPAVACESADLVLLSTPVGSFTDLVKNISRRLKKGCVVTDAGSVKGALVSEIEGLMPPTVHYIGAHPIAGGDRSGIDASHEDLFSGALCIVTPTDRSDKTSLDALIRLWESLGARVERMDPIRHDRVFAAVSHLPHVVAYSLVNAVHELGDGFMEYAGPGFRDTTRIAASSPEIWRDICMYNRENLVSMVATLQKNLDAVTRHLQRRDSEALEEEFRKAQRLRHGLR